jgi:DHA1 family tetracycline resistance protein-like MFS transporter
MTPADAAPAASPGATPASEPAAGPSVAPSIASKPAAGRGAALPFILVVVLLDMISIGVMLPVLPHIVGTFTSSNDEQTLAFLAVTAAFGFANFVGSPVLGALSDRFGRRPVLLLGISGLALSFFVTAAATALWVLVAVRFFSGAMQSNVSVANAYVADITPPEERARRFGLVGAMFGVGFILGPVLGGLLGEIDVRLPFVVAGSLALLNFAYGFFVLPESLPPERRRPFEWRRANPVAALRGLVALKGVGALVWVVALAGLAQFMLHSIWVLYTKFKFGWGPGQVGVSLFVVGLMSALSQGVLIKPMLARFGAPRLAVIAMAAGALSYLGFGLAWAPAVVYAVMLLGLLSGMATAAMQSIISNAADARTQGQTMGSVSSLNSLMAVFAPLFGLELLRWVSHRPAGDVWIGLPFFVIAALQGAATLVAWQFFRRRERLAHAATA